MTAAELFAKARRALESAKILLDMDDCDGACNRAYYAMFDAQWALGQVQEFIASIQATFFKITD